MLSHLLERISKILTDTCSITTLAAGATCAVTVAYTPAAGVIADEAATLTITDKGAGASVATVNLTGVPTLPSTFTVVGGPDLGSVAPGMTGTEVIFTVTNTSTTPSGAVVATVSNANITISSNTCATKATLNKGDTCTVGLKLTPAANAQPQAIAALLTVTGANGKASASVTGSIVTGPALSANPLSVNFGSVPVNQVSAVKSVTITNTGATATGVLAVTLSGARAAQVAITGNTCTAALAPAKTCTVAVQYSPTDPGDVNGIITVTDGTTSATITMVGTGLAPSLIGVHCFDSSALDPSCTGFGNVVKGYAATNMQILTVTASAAATTDSGTIATAFTGAAAADFTVVPDATDPSICGALALQPGQSCNLHVAFTPSDVGLRQATLTVTGSKGGVFPVPMTGTGLALVELDALDASAAGASPVVTGLDFGQQPNGTPGAVHHYQVVVRGTTSVATTSTVASVTLATSTPADFLNVALTNGSWINTNTNPCTAATLPLTATTGVPVAPVPPATGPANWSIVGGFWTCNFYIQFYPQTGKSVTAKTATVNASATASEAAVLTLTGKATGPLTISPDSYTFGSSFSLGTSSETNPIVSASTTITVDQTDAIASFTVANQGVSGVSQGPLTVALGGTDVGDFGILTDACSGQTLAANTATGTCSPTILCAAGSTCVGGVCLSNASICVVQVAFAPSSVGTKTATISASSATDSTNPATINGAGTTGVSIAVAPVPTAPAPAVDLGSVAQANVGNWVTFTISNPTGAPLSGKLDYTLDSTTDFEIFNLVNSGAASYPAGACGDPLTKQIAGGENCTIQVRFKPVNTDPASATPRTTNLNVIDGTKPALVTPIQGTATPQLVLSGAAVTMVKGAQTVDFGQSATGVGATESVTVTNHGAANAAGSVTLAFTLPANYSVATTSGCAVGTVIPGQGSCQLDITFTGLVVDALPVTSTITPPISNGTTKVTAPLNLTAQAVSPAVLALSGFGDYLTATPAANQVIDLGAAALNANTGTLTLVFTNTGGVPAQQLDKTIVETPTGTEFTVAAENPGTCLSGAALAPQKTCTVNVRFTPTTLGLKTAVFSLFAAAVSPVNVNLRALAISPSASVYAVVKGATNSLYTFPGSTVPTSTGTKVYFELHNNVAGVTLNLTGDTTNPLGPDITFVAGVGRPTDFVLAKETDATGVACGASLSPAGICVFSVTFKPALWEGSGTLYRWATIAYNASTTPAGTAGPIAAVIGQVQKPAKLQLTAASTTTITITGTSPSFDANFGQILEQQSASLTFTIQNIGEAATAGAVGATLAAGAASYATVTNTCGTTALAAGATCTATVTVSSTLGTHSGGTVQATGAASEISDEIYSLSVNVVNAAHLVLTNTGTAATPTPAGQTGTSLTITVTNGVVGTDTSANRQDSGPLTVSLTPATDFTVDTSTASTCIDQDTGTYLTSLAGGGQCTIVVMFTPQSAGAKTTTLSVGATPGGTTQTVTLTGNALGDLLITPPSTAATPVALTVPASGPIVGSFSVINNGPKATGLLKESLGGTNKALFAITSDSCFGQNLQPGDTCLVSVVFLGTSNGTTAQTATLNVTDGSPNSNVTAYMKVGGP